MWQGALHVEGADIEGGRLSLGRGAAASRVRRGVGHRWRCRCLCRVILGWRDHGGVRSRGGSRGLGLCSVVAADKRQGDDGEQGNAGTEQSGFHGNSFLNKNNDVRAATWTGWFEPSSRTSNHSRCDPGLPSPRKTSYKESSNGGLTGLDKRDSTAAFPQRDSTGCARPSTYLGYDHEENGSAQTSDLENLSCPLAKINQGREITAAAVAPRTQRLTARSPRYDR
jgi:hypothetical protein